MEFFSQNISVGVVLLLAFLHFVADFLFQTDYMANNKSKSNKALGLHVLVYSLPFLVIGWEFAVVNLVLHFSVDFVTSRMTSKLFAEKKVGLAFKVIGFDQFLHTLCLIITYMLMVEM